MATPLETSDAWIRARDRYVEDLNEKEQQLYFSASPESLLGEARTAENSHRTSSTTRKVMEKLQPFVAAIEQYGNAVDVYSNTYSLALGPIWGSIKVLLHIARGFGKYFDKLVDMFARIGDVLPRFRTYERLFSNHEHLIEALSMAFLDIIKFCTNAKTVFRRGQRSSKTTLKMTFKLLWKPFDQQFGQQLSDFRKHQKNVEKEAGLAHMIESADARAMVLADQKQLEKRRREDNRLRILDLLQAVDYEAKHRKLQNLRLAGTGDWLFRHAAYVEWKTSGDPALLCCRGIPGCGKSIIASNLVDHLMGSASSALDVIYYYCDYADQRTLQLIPILGSFLKQMVLDHQIPEHIEMQLLQLYAGGTRSPPENALSDIFYSMAALRPELYLVLDGLDECEKPVWRAMLTCLERLGTIGQCNIKIFITCVEEGSVSHHLASHKCIQLSPAATSEDISLFVTSSVRSRIEGGDLKIRNPKLERDIITELLSRANGMFLWVFFQLNDLCEASSDAMIREILDNLPEGLGETYRRILIKINRSPLRARLAGKVLQWTTVAKRPLHVEELREAVAFGPDDKGWEEDKIPEKGLMLESCRGLIIKDHDDGTVHFAHHTVRQYLTGGISPGVDPDFDVTVCNAEAVAGRTCVAYLSFSDFEAQLTSATPTVTLEQKGVLESGGPLWIPSVLGIRKSMFNIPYRLLQGNPAVQTPDSDYWKHLRPRSKPNYNPSTDLKEKYRLLCYAIEYWEPHMRLNRTTDSVFDRRVENLALHKKLAFDFRPWGVNQHFGPYGCVGCPSPTAKTPMAKHLPYIFMIHYAAKVGNLTLLTFHGSTQWKIRDYLNHERYNQETLLIACRHNRVEIVEFVIQQANYDVSDGRAVNAAAAAGHTEVLQYLLTLGQYPLKQQGVSLLFAAGNGHFAATQTLLEFGLPVDKSDARGQSALQVAAQSGHSTVVELLLDYGADPSAIRDTESPVYLAAKGGHINVLASFNKQFPIKMTRLNGLGHISLHGAAIGGQDKAVRWLVEHGADVNKLDYRGKTPLCYATELGIESTVRALLELGAIVLIDAITQDIIGTSVPSLGFRSSLVHAAKDDNLSILQMLLESIRKDQQTPNESKCRAILAALLHIHRIGILRAPKLLQQALELYSEGKSFEDLCREYGFKIPEGIMNDFIKLRGTALIEDSHTTLASDCHP